MYLKHVFLQEVQDAGLDVDNAVVYDLEDLRSDHHGLIRQKGASLICPRDGQLGTSYLNAIIEDNKSGVGIKYVNRANVLLSYTWGYEIKVIVETLVAKCRTDGRDPKKTYIWLDCLCRNWNRAYISTEVSFDKHMEEIQTIVTGVGRIWSMMFPWNNPQSLKRVWCLFEIYVAITEVGVEAEIIMPVDQEEAMINSLNDDINNLLDVLSNTHIENAMASKQEDRRKILTLVEEKIGFTHFNSRVNALLIEWIRVSLVNAGKDDDAIDEILKSAENWQKNERA